MYHVLAFAKLLKLLFGGKHDVSFTLNLDGLLRSQSLGLLDRRGRDAEGVNSPPSPGAVAWTVQDMVLALVSLEEPACRKGT